MTIERAILSNLLINEQYTRKTLPFIRREYFNGRDDSIIFDLIDTYVTKYNALPTKQALLVDLSNKDNLTDDQFKSCKQLIEDITTNQDTLTSIEWITEQTEKYCQDRAIYNAIMQSIKIMDDKTGKMSKGAIPELLSDALAVSFDTSIGHDFIEDATTRFEFYHRKEEKIPFDIDYLNTVTRGGLSRKTLNCFIASTGVGKSLVMCHMAAANLVDSKNVLYITMEMSEEKIAERIDANLLNVRLDELYELPADVYMKKIGRLKEKVKGRLIVKEYPTSTAGSANFRHLINELKMKKNFIPDIVYVDYLNICMSSRLKQGANVNSYTYIKTIAEEIRGLAVEFNIPIVTATQTNREGFDNTDIGMTNTSESIGLPATLDFFCALISSDELKALNQIMFKQLKNRYNDPELYKRFVVGVDKSKMRLYNCESTAQADIVDDSPVYDKTPSGSKFNKEKFADFK